MTSVKIDCNKIHDWESFHDVFAENFGFPGFYGRNMNAWIDCMSYLDDPESGMTKVTCLTGDYIILALDNVRDFHKDTPDVYEAIIECAAFVNWRRLEANKLPLLMLSFYK